MTAVVERPPWVRCTSCSALLYRKRLRRNLDVCPECGDHRRLTRRERIAQLVDPDSFRPLAPTSRRVDPIGFVDLLPYPQRLAAARAATGLAEAVLCGAATHRRPPAGPGGDGLPVPRRQPRLRRPAN